MRTIKMMKKGIPQTRSVSTQSSSRIRRIIFLINTWKQAIEPAIPQKAITIWLVLRAFPSGVSTFATNHLDLLELVKSRIERISAKMPTLNKPKDKLWLRDQQKLGNISTPAIFPELVLKRTLRQWLSIIVFSCAAAMYYFSFSTRYRKYEVW